MMLSRVADSMFWVGRYVERAENIARFIDVNLQLTLDFEDVVAQQWRPLVSTSGDQALFEERYGEATRENVLQFLTFDEKYPGSIISCLSAARENARQIRETISTAMWDAINMFYLSVREAARHPIPPSEAADFYAEVRRGSQLFVGVTDGTLTHDEAWRFSRMGRFIERADKTSRILDVKYFLLLPEVSDVGAPIDIVQWSALLRSASALDMYRATHGRLAPAKVAGYLLLDRNFPRAVYHCVTQAERSMHAISGTPEGVIGNGVERRLGRLRAELEYLTIEDVFETGLHETIDTLQNKLNAIDGEIHEFLFSSRPLRDADGPSQQS